MRYRCVDDPSGNQWAMIGGGLLQDHQAYVCKDPTKFADSITSDYEKVGYVNAATDGWTKELGWDKAHPYVRLPFVVGGSNTTYFCDYYWQNGGLRVAYVGGALATGATAGLVPWDCADGVGAAGFAIGARLSYTA